MPLSVLHHGLDLHSLNTDDEMKMRNELLCFNTSGSEQT